MNFFQVSEVLKSYQKVSIRLIAVVSLMSPLCQGAAQAAEPGVPLPSPTIDSPKAASTGSETAVLAGGCFWGVQAVFEHMKGVEQVLSGYSGGEKSTAHYEQVSDGKTGHAESVQIRFNPKEVSYGQILKVFFSVAHNPTELNRQGPDTGTQYRSAVFYTNPIQQKVAQAYIAQLNKAAVFPKPIVTQIDTLKAFYPAEGYHQDYLIHNPTNPYIVINDLPKIANFKYLLPEVYREKPVMVSGGRS